MRIKYEDLNINLRARVDNAIRRQDSGDRSRPQVANVEPDSSLTPKATNAVEAFDSPVDIRIHSIRRRRTDADGVSAKWAIDGLIASGIITDDGPDYVKSVTFTQEQGRPERTIITLKPTEKET